MFTKQATLIRRSIVVIRPFELVFPALIYIQLCQILLNTEARTISQAKNI
jgi:hypothetical protein